MADATRSKQVVEGISDKIQNVTTAPKDLNDIIHKSSLDLINALGDNVLIVTNEVIQQLNGVNTGIAALSGPAGTVQSEINTITPMLAAPPAGIPNNDPRRVGLQDRLNHLNAIQAKGAIAYIQRQNEYIDLRNCAQAFNLTNTIPAVSVDLGGAATVSTALDIRFMPLGAPGLTGGGVAPRNYRLCDATGVVLPQSGGQYTIQLPVITGGTTSIQAVQVSGITFTAAGNIDITNIQFTPPNVDISQPIKLSINGTFENIGGTNLIINKKFELNVANPILGPACTTPGLRNVVINSYNAGSSISNSLIANFNNQRAKIEREAFFRAVAHKDGPKFDKLSDRQKEDLYQRVRNQYITQPWYITPTGNLPGTILPVTAGLNTMQSYTDFRGRFTADSHPGSKRPYTNTETDYMNYINNNLEDQIGIYFNQRFDEIFINDLTRNMYLKTEVTDYLTEIEENKLDNDTHVNVDTDLTTIEMESRRRFGLFGRNDKNYMRFFGGARVDMGEQTVNIATNTAPEDLKNPEPVKYTMRLAVSTKNQMSAIIKIGGQKEREISAGNPMALMQHILRMSDIPYGKVRMHMAYNVAKGMIQYAKQQNISLSYRNPANNHNMIINIDETNKNIVLEDQDDITNYGGNNRRITETLFDHSLFESTNSFDTTIPNDNRSLRQGIEGLTTHFNHAMNGLHQNFTQATERRWGGLRKSASTMEFPTSYWMSPIKKLLNCKTTTNFDFSTNVQVGPEGNKKAVTINFKGNKITLTMEGLKKPISGKSLGKLLNHREGGVRVFDGLERDIIGEIYKNMVEKLRTNTKIARSNFGALDPMTGRIYILDEDGKMGYISAEAARTYRLRRTPGVNTIVNTAITGGLVGGGIAAGGVAALTGGLSRGAAGTASSRGAAGLTGANLINDIMNIGNSGYGIIDHPPAGRLICDEAETKEVLKNPFLMGKFMKAANLRLGKF